MNFPDYFADAEASLNDAEYVIVGVPYDKTSSFRPGAKKAPEEIRKASWNFETYNFKTGIDLRDIRFHDYGNVDVDNVRPDEMVKIVKDLVTQLLRKNKFPIVIGGEHSITSGVVQAFPEDIMVLSLDAHLDFRDKYENEENSHACANRRITDHIKVENLVVLGVRSAEKEEFENAKKKKLFYIDSFEIEKRGIKKVLEETKKHIGNKQVYLTLDIDVLDPVFAPGTSTPEPLGLTPFDVLDCIDYYSSQFVGFDLVEVCPPFDNGETALLAAKFIREFIRRTWQK